MGSETRRNPMLIISEDDDDDFFLIQKSLANAGLSGNILRFTDGETLMEFLLRHKDNAGDIQSMVILLDLNMPRKDGRETLKEIKTHPKLKRIPVIVLTTSSAEDDLVQSYDLGANAFARKPSSFEEFQQLVKMLGDHWTKAVALPPVK